MCYRITTTETLDEPKCVLDCMSLFSRLEALSVKGEPKDEMHISINGTLLELVADRPKRCRAHQLGILRKDPSSVFVGERLPANFAGC